MNEPIDCYADIIHLPAPRPKNRTPMPRRDRAAQFSAFAALSGHDAAIRETARLTDARPELSEGAKAEMDEQLRLLLMHPGAEVQLTWFVADDKKAGGACHSAVCRVRKIDTAQRCLLLEDERRVALDDILNLQLL